jgi:hypothetical protein
LLLDYSEAIDQNMCDHLLAMDQFLGGMMYFSSILIYSHQHDLLLLLVLNGEEVSIADLYIIASTPMDTIITSWRHARKSQSTLGQHIGISTSDALTVWVHSLENHGLLYMLPSLG